MKSNYTRRQFLQRTAATAGALAAANAIALPDHRFEAAAFPADLSKPDAVETAFADIRARFGEADHDPADSPDEPPEGPRIPAHDHRPAAPGRQHPGVAS